jgi:ATP-binding cassette subfamily B protein
MMAIGWVANMIQRGAASMRRLNRVFNEVPEIQDVATQQDMGLLQGGIEFRGAGITYPGAGRPAIREVRFTVEVGQTVALVGKVGCGKSTLLQVIPRLFDVPRGTVFIDGRDIQDIPLKSLRKSIGFVTQEVFIFSDTIRNNVLFGREGISEETLVMALKTAEIYEEIMALDQGLDSLLGERGITLSGGQRQRLSIARAILTDPPVLILDDALSMVDTRTEERILNHILESRKGKTNLIVSHRISTISRAEVIAVLVDGELVETGDHQTLIEKGKEYSRLYERQRLEQELEIEPRNNGMVE